MSLDGRASSSTAIDQEQLDQRLSKLIVDHNNYRAHLVRYIRRALALCTWHIDFDNPSWFQQFEKTDKLINLVHFIREHAMQSFQAIDRLGSALLNQVDVTLARANSMPPTAGSPLAGSMSPSRASQSQPGTDHPGITSPRAISFSTNRLLYLAGELKEALRFWREQCLCAGWLEPKVYEMGRIGELRDLALTGEGSTIEEKARGIRIWCEQARLVTDQMEPFLDQWQAKLAAADRLKEDQGYGGSSHLGSMNAANIGPNGGGAGSRTGSFSAQSVDSPAPSHSSQP